MKYLGEIMMLAILEAQRTWAPEGAGKIKPAVEHMCSHETMSRREEEQVKPKNVLV